MNKQSRHTASRLRQQIRLESYQLQRLLARLVGPAELVKGSLYLWKHTCGRRGCHCQAGEPHRSWVLSYYQDGKLVKRYVSDEDIESVRGRVEAYRGFRQARGKLARTQQSLLQLLDRLQAALEEAPPEKSKGRKR